MMMGKEVFESKATLQHLTIAIQQRSVVYRRIVACPGDAYKPALEALQKLMP